MVGSIVIVSMAATIVCAFIGIGYAHLNDRRSEVRETSVLRAVRDLGGRATALQVTTRIGWRDSETPYEEVRAHLEAMTAEGVLRAEWMPISSWDTTPRRIYVLNDF